MAASLLPPRLGVGLLGLALSLAWPAGAATLPAPPSVASPQQDGTRAQIVATRRAVIASALSGRIDRLPFREGERFARGDALVVYDCALNRARLQRAAQAEAAARKKLAVAEQLDALRSISQADVEQARAAVEVARAETGVERVLVERCTITAPFSGRVADTYARAAESVGEGEKLLSIYDDSAFEVETIVPSHWLAWLKPGSPLRVTVEETGKTYAASVSHIAGAVDPVSQSVKIIGRLAANASAGAIDLLPGMSGMVHAAAPESSVDAP